jgi:hypothetical protein
VQQQQPPRLVPSRTHVLQYAETVALPPDTRASDEHVRAQGILQHLLGKQPRFPCISNEAVPSKVMPHSAGRTGNTSACIHVLYSCPQRELLIDMVICQISELLMQSSCKTASYCTCARNLLELASMVRSTCEFVMDLH